VASELTKRVAVAAIGIPFALIVLYVGGWIMAAVLAAIAAAAAGELYRIARQRGIEPFIMIGCALAALPVLSTVLARHDPGTAMMWSWLIFLAATPVVASVALFGRGVTRAPLTAMSVTIFGAFFTGGTLACAMFLRMMPVASEAPHAQRWVGPAFVLFPLALTWISDTAAFFGGRAFGRRKLMPSVSPGKTVAGAVAGVVGTVAAGTVYAHFVFRGWLGVPVSAAAGALAGLIVSPVAQVGDLVESLLKREAGVKDSGALLPGHGGVLDRFDSLFFTIPVTYWLLATLLGTGVVS
jgi:phosphatidate cytidylyltransferase